MIRLQAELESFMGDQHWDLFIGRKWVRNESQGLIATCPVCAISLAMS